MIIADYRISRNYEAIVANALPSAPGVNDVLAREAQAIVGTARSVMDLAPRATSSDAKNVEDVKSQITILPAAMYFRGRKSPQRQPKVNNTKIPIVLVVSNAWQSKWYEFGKGRGNHFPALHFMRKAAYAANSNYGKFKPRGRSKRAA